MGGVGSAHRPCEDDIWWTNGQTKVEPAVEKCSSQNATTDINKHFEAHREIDQDFKYDMERRHVKRREIIAAKKKEFDDLRQEVARLKQENELLKLNPQNEAYVKMKEDLDRFQNQNRILKSELKDKLEELQKVASLLEKNRELKISIAEMQDELQKLNAVVVEFEKEREEYKAHVVALKDVINVSKKMLLIRESQLKELKQKVESIEQSLSAKEMNILSQDLRQEYERQLASIRNLRTLYEDRQRSDHKEKEELKKLLEDCKKEFEAEQNKSREFEERIVELEELNSKNYDEIKSLESNLGLSKAECRQYQAELTVINQLFSEILLGFNSSQDIDLDKLVKHLEQHHELLQNIVFSELSSESSSALPKILLDLVNEVNSRDEKSIEFENSPAKLETIVEESESQTGTDQINSAEEIVELLPKVWRVLIELLSHQKAPTNILSFEMSSGEDLCYKTVQTPKGPSLVLSVSQTFIRLKDLILEKKSLEKETGHLKQLNTHLENRLQDQEKRLQSVSCELDKTWHVVGKLQKEHQLLHTQEKILRYELAQKRKLLNTLKEELEYSREKWQQAREKNSKTEKQWKQLRVEFASRKNPVTSDVYSNSQESGYSDERCTSSDDRCISSDDEPGYETDISTDTSPKPVQNTKRPTVNVVAEDGALRVEDVSAERLVSSVIEEAIAAIVKSDGQSNPQNSHHDHSNCTEAGASSVGRNESLETNIMEGSDTVSQNIDNLENPSSSGDATTNSSEAETKSNTDPDT
ncbi:cingulin [Sitophilus oryzae]|uniref:Cingulin n=1 Tax=Sitophilus oryzae TaxID=7048 RepID=A0A6J2YWS9_SITOR|nr:cingulin [Sitophilus oryzae]XP_030767730.1 cingulin [Sitophilus oryzae]XP_030767731.1 cingulin [Sitophilus oryzae]XP_030767732.1 cingulin [Sitophilus oryzae]